MKLRVGVIGLGDAWESRHRGALRALSDRFEVRAISSDVAVLGEQAAREFGAHFVDGFQTLARREDIDAVLLLSSQWYGPLPILAACASGKAVYCATALEIDPEKARSVKLRVERSGVAFMAEFPRRHAAATLRLKELIATRLGEPQLVFCHQRFLVDPRNGREQRAARVSPEMRELMELVDWCRYVVDREPSGVVSVAHGKATRHEDYQMISLDFSAPGERGGGPLAQISCGRYLPRHWQEAIAFRAPAAMQVCCEHGIAFVDLPATIVWFDNAGRHFETLESERPVGEQLLTQFYRAVTSLLRKISDLEDAYRALQIVEAARTSRLEGKRVELQFSIESAEGQEGA